MGKLVIGAIVLTRNLIIVRSEIIPKYVYLIPCVRKNLAILIMKIEEKLANIGYNKIMTNDETCRMVK
jgi:hypothetical protein